jgi:beta-lactamase regulating signal transducer with metallopeptidase domain
MNGTQDGWLSMNVIDWLVVGCLVVTLFLIVSQVLMGRKVKDLEGDLEEAEAMIELLATHAMVQAEIMSREALEKLKIDPYYTGGNSEH